jgi:hypothetical protein
MRRFTPFVVIVILFLCFFIIGLIFDNPTGSFSIWNQLSPPEKNKITGNNCGSLIRSSGGKPTISLASILPIPRPGGGKPT